MKNYIIRAAIIFLSLLISLSIRSQDCITFHSDFTGMEWDEEELTDITTAACELRTLLDSAGVAGFEVHTLGLYAYNPYMQGGTEAVWNQFLADNIDTSAPHLAIGKEIELDGEFKRFWVSFYVPSQGMLACLTQNDKDVIISLLTSLNTNNNYVFHSPINIINKAKSYLSVIACRCGNECSTPNLNYIEDKLTLLGYANYNHLDKITFEAKSYTGSLASNYRILLHINANAASPESFPNRTFELTEELNDFIGDVGGSAVVYYIDKNNVGQFEEILNGGSSFTGGRSGTSYSEKIFLINLNGQVKVYYSIDGNLPVGFGNRSGGTVQKFIKWFCKRAAATPLTTIGGVIVDYAAESTIEYFFNNDDNKYGSYTDAFYEVAYRRGIIGLVISVGTNLYDSPLINFVGAFLNHFVTVEQSKWDPLQAFAQASLGTLIQGCGAQVKNIPAVKKYIANILIDVGNKPGIFKHFIFYPSTLKSWRILKDLDDKSGINRAWIRQNLDLLTKMSSRDNAYQLKIEQFYKNFALPRNFVPEGTYKGIKYNKWGFPDFSGHYPKNLKNYKYFSETLSSGNSDFSKAFNQLKENNPSVPMNKDPFQINGKRYSWHHLEDGKTLVPVEYDIHRNLIHTGGASVIKNGLQGFFGN